LLWITQGHVHLVLASIPVLWVPRAVTKSKLAA